MKTIALFSILIAVAFTPSRSQAPTVSPGNVPTSTRNEYQIHRVANQSASTDPFWHTTVRIRIDRGNGESMGSGTIIDSPADGKAVILTCAHVVRDAEKVSVDTFAGELIRRPGNSPTIAYRASLPGKVIARDSRTDLALVEMSYDPKWKRSPTSPIVPSGFHLHPGDDVDTAGCSDGENATFYTTSILRDGGRWVEAKNAPIPGRSGGGMFARGAYSYHLCGVVFAFNGVPSPDGKPLGGTKGPAIGVFVSPVAIHQFLLVNNFNHLVDQTQRYVCPSPQCEPISPRARPRGSPQSTEPYLRPIDPRSALAPIAASSDWMGWFRLHDSIGWDTEAKTAAFIFALAVAIALYANHVEKRNKHPAPSRMFP